MTCGNDCGQKALMIISAYESLPGAPEFVVHDGDEVESLRETADVSERGALGTVPWSDRGGSREDEVLANCVLAESLEEREEVVGILSALDIAANTLSTGVLPVKVNTINLPLSGEVGDGLDKGCAVLRSGNVGREVDGSTPSTDGNERLDAL